MGSLLNVSYIYGQARDMDGFCCLKDIYYSVPIYEKRQKYLKSLWEYPLKLIDISNGYKLAMRAFTKLLKPTFSFLRSDFFLRSKIFQLYM